MWAKVWQQVVQATKELAGDGGYTRYCRHLRAKHPGAPVPGAKEFYLDRLEEKYARPNRCC